MPFSIVINNKLITIVNQDVNNENKLNCLITDDQTINNQNPTTWDAICEIRSSVAAMLVPRLSTDAATAMTNPMPGMIYHDLDQDRLIHYSSAYGFKPLVTSKAPTTTVANGISTWGDETATEVLSTSITIDPITNNLTLPAAADLIMTSNGATYTIAASDFLVTNTILTLPAVAATQAQVLTALDDNGNTTWSDNLALVNLTGSTGLNIVSSPLANGVQNITATLSSELQGLSGQNALGLVTRTALGQYNESTITAGSNNIVVTNGNGVAGNPTLDLSLMPIVNSITINNAPVASTDGVNKQYADALVAGLDFKNLCFAATASNLNATYSNGASGVDATLTNNGNLSTFGIDGVTPILNARILVKNQAIPAQNGIYTLTTIGLSTIAWVLTRSTDYNAINEITPGNLIAIESGTINNNTVWLETSIVNTIGTSGITFTQFAYGPSSFLQASNNLSDLSNITIAVANLGLGNVAMADLTNPATTGYIPFSNNSNGTDLVRSYNCAKVYADNNGVLNLIGNGIQLNGGGAGVTVAQALNLASNGFVTSLAANPTLSENYTLTLPSQAPNTSQMLLSDGSGNFTWVNEPVTQITVGNGLLGGTITTSGTISLPTTGVMATTYPYATITVDQYGRITSAGSNTPVTSVATSTSSVGILLGGSPIQSTGILTIDLNTELQALAALTFTLPTNNGTVGQYLQTNGDGTTNWAPGDGMGTVTSIATGTGLTGGPITSTGTISLANTAVTSGNYNYGSFTVNSQGQLTSANSGFVNTNGTGAADTVGFATLNGTTGVTVNTSTVTANSIITVTRNVGVNTPPDVTTIGNLIVGSINATNSFTVYSTTVNDLGNFNWLIINP